MSPVHSLNNLALVVWAFLSFDDYDAAVGEAVNAGWDTDCNGATVGGLMGMHLSEIPPKWHEPWNGRVCTSISGLGELVLEDLVNRTMLLVSKFSDLEDKKF
jgi:ADP-ribosylglycohydrolase